MHKSMLIGCLGLMAVACGGSDAVRTQGVTNSADASGLHSHAEAPVDAQSLPRTRLLDANAVVGSAESTIPHGFSTAATAGGPGFELWHCEFDVPPVPSYGGQSIFLWCGVQQSSGVTPTGDSSFGVLQPVLMFGPDCVQYLPPGKGIGPGKDPTYDSDPYWYVSAQYIYPDPVGSTTYTCTTGPVYKVAPGNTLVSRMQYDFEDDSMEVAVTVLDGNVELQTSSLTVDHPWNDPGQSWSQFIGGNSFIMEAVSEVYHLDPSRQWPLGDWEVTAFAEPLPDYPFQSNEQWALAPWNNGPPPVTCSTESGGDTSLCTWAFPSSD